MNRIKKSIALLIAVVALVAMALPAFADQDEAHDLHYEQHDPNICLYGYASVTPDAPAPGTAKVFAQGTTIVRGGNPCTFALTTQQEYGPGFMKVQASLRCRWGGGPGQVVWTSPIKSNTDGTGSVTVQDKGYDGSGTQFRCTDPDNLGLEARTVVTSWMFTPFGYVSWQVTTHWVEVN